MAKIPDGCILIARQIFESEIWNTKPDWYLKAWIYILGKVNHTDNKYFKRGTNFFTYQQIYDDCRMAKTGNKVRNVDHLIRWLKSATQIATQKTTRGLIITVLKYNEFQNMQNYKSDTESDTESEIKATQKRHRSDTINNNDNNVKNERITPIVDTLQYEKAKTAIQQVVEHYKILKGYDKQDDWDKHHFSRHTKSAKELLKINGDDVEKAIACMRWLANEYKLNGLNWEIETCAKKQPEYIKSKERSSEVFAPRE